MRPAETVGAGRPARVRALSALRARLPARRPALKALHWALVPLFVWFLVVTPADTVRIGRWMVDLHSDLALVFTSLSLLWVALYLRRGLASRPGPKLKGAVRSMHQAIHKGLIWGLGALALTGFGLGLTSPVMLRAGGWLPIAPPLDLEAAHEVVSALHWSVFYALAALAAGHAAFHVWRHLHLRDNALRIMAPKALHRFL